MFVFLGAGGFAREAYWVYNSLYGPISGNVKFVDDVSDTTELEIGGRKFEVLKNWSQLKGAEFVVAVGDPNSKNIMVEKALVAGATPASYLISPDATVNERSCFFGRGGVVCPGVRISDDVRIGNYVSLGSNVTIGHDVKLRHYVTVNPGANVSGNVSVEKMSLIGGGSFIREKIRIESGSVVGGGAVVVKNVAAGTTVIGVPAKPMTKWDVQGVFRRE